MTGDASCVSPEPPAWQVWQGGSWLGTAVAAGTLGEARGQTQDADLVVFNARVYTVDSRMPKVEAFAVQAGRFIAVGSTAEMKALIGKGTQTFDAKQMTVVPGFIDCHNHAPGDVLLYEVLVGNPYVVEFVTIWPHAGRRRTFAAASSISFALAVTGGTRPSAGSIISKVRLSHTRWSFHSEL